MCSLNDIVERMKAKTIILGAIFLLCTLSFPVQVVAQEEKDWDRILDRYEHLCNECIDLKIQAQAELAAPAARPE